MVPSCKTSILHSNHMLLASYFTGSIFLVASKRSIEMEATLISKFSTVTHFELPQLPNNIPFAYHPQSATISPQIDEWMLRKMKITDRSVRKKMIHSKIGLYACMMHPNAEREKLVLAGKNLWALLLIDDLLESSSKEEMPRLNTTITNLGSGNSRDGAIRNPVLLLYKEVLGELRAAMEPPLLDRYLHCLAASLEGVRKQVHHRTRKSVPEPEEYKLTRRANGFMDILGGIMTEFCMGIRLNQAQIQSPTFRELLNSVSDYVILVNDLLSFRKEFYGGDYHHNWISVLSYHGPTGIRFQDVIDQLCEMIQAEEHSILALQKKIADEEGCDSELTKFASELAMVASGSLVWSYLSGRYHGYDNPLITGEIFSGTWLLHPVATVVFPSIKARP
ncbi:(3S,6E)-nerolidol synthase-like [Selaginella moellendorffii]|nr:(3S,6E)-nerolidol synthase-like [Selaginella moellendorffii]|eukprot:XP_002972730.2 (3S,6E)-nerolidol synthase-like [Selaginella moellendorffii]